MAYEGFDAEWLAKYESKLRPGEPREPVQPRKACEPTQSTHNAHPEEDEQASLFEWANLMTGKHPELAALYAIPNGAHLAGTEKQRWAQMARLKKTGLKPGVSDVCLPVKRGRYGSLWVEMKAPGKLGNVTEDQKIWGELMERVGNMFIVLDNAKDAARVIVEYLEDTG